MDLQELMKNMQGEGWAALTIGFLTLVQIAPIKLNPWSWLGKHIGKALNGEVLAKVDKLGNDVQHLKDRYGEHEAKAARVRILQFGDELYQDRDKRHTKERFDQILEDVSDYEDYCRTHPDFPNEKTVMTVENIKAIYRECLKKHSFL